MADNDGDQKEKQSAAPRPYLVLSELTLDLSNPDAVVEQLKQIAGDSKNVEVLAKVGRGMGAQAKQALSAVAQIKSLQGEYSVASESAFKPLKVKTEQQVKVSIE